METNTKRCFNGTTGEQVPNFLIKQEVEWLAEDSYVPDLENQEVDLNVEPIRSIKAEIDPCHTDAGAHAVQEFTPVPQTDDCIKAELILDEEIRDKKSDSEANCKQLVLPLGDDQQAIGSGSDKGKCGSSHTLKGNLNIQMHTKHEAQPIIPLECQFRSRTFERKDHFRRRLSTHDEDGNGVSACDLCEKRHKDAHAKASTFICAICGASFTQNANLKRHMLATHLEKAKLQLLGPQTADDSKNTDTVVLLDGEAAFYGLASQKSAARDTGACEVCQNIYPKELIRTHMSMAHSKPKHKCEICSRLFKRKHDSTTHLSTHATDRKRDFVCDICERTFCEKKKLASHMKLFAQKEHPKSNCEVCSSSFTKKGDLDVHMATKHLDKARSIIPASQTAEDDDSIPTGTEEFLDAETAFNMQPSQKSDSKDSESKSELKSEACEICHGFYPTEYIRTHMHLAHSNPNHNCEVCSRVFKKKSDLKVHLKTHDKDRKREFVCHICERAYYEKRKLIRHMKHYGEKNHPKLKCFCGSSFTRKGDLDEHMLTEHSEKSQPIIPASQTADHNSINANQISENMRTEGGTFECIFCSRSFTTKANVKRHFRTHFKDRKRQFACDLCDNKFYHQSSLLTHKRIHHLTPQPSNDTGVPMKIEQMSDEEFIDERND